MNHEYIYPQNLKSQAKLWLWNLKDIAVLGIGLLISILALSQVKLFLPLALTLCYGFLTIRLDDMTVLEFIKRAVKYFFTSQQYYEWKENSVRSRETAEDAQQPKKKSIKIFGKEVGLQ